MATVTHYIRSEYEPEIDKDRLLRETGQIDQDDTDHWQIESSSAGFHRSNRLAHPPNFVPALLPYDQWASPAGFTPPAEPTPTDGPGDVATWYRSLSRQSADPAQKQQQPPTSESSPRGSPPPQILDTRPRPPPAAPNKQQHRDRGRRRRDWFISRAISHSAPPTKTPPGPPSSSASLADILSRNPPAATRPLRPPVFLHLGPSNRGWAMLRNQGWAEGEGLGAAASTSTGGKRRKRRRKAAATDDDDDEADDGDEAADDDIVEVLRKAPVPLIIDLTQSDTEDQEGEGEGEEEERQRQLRRDEPDPVPEHGGRPDDTPATPTIDPDNNNNNDSSDPRAAQTALLTPLPTVLKSDRLGIGLKAKTEGPYRSSVKRVTHNAAALAAHARAAEDVRRAQRRFGKGRRAFARIERLERESRQNVMAYLSEP
ncbi:hypothetical protein BJV78DRAFT_1277107 [Lactifluus subvellereus]|nr:hypothetical protein BJV78DRAFT_1277107 [Lactifluus subvellereus]